jgi:hypothetical protein
MPHLHAYRGQSKDDAMIIVQGEQRGERREQGIRDQVIRDQEIRHQGIRRFTGTGGILKNAWAFVPRIEKKTNRAGMFFRNMGN